MKRSAMEHMTYEIAVKKAQLVERNPAPNGLPLVSPSRVSMHDEMDIISLAEEIQKADKNLRSNTCGKLCLILDQIRFLQSQAADIIREANESMDLNKIACNFVKQAGKVYHLYQKPSGQKYFSILTPEDWNGYIEQTYLGSYRLENDFSWTAVDKIEERDQKMNIAAKLIQQPAIEAICAPSSPMVTNIITESID
ncbi:uncharacterized protein C1orf50 homolog [Teleopsis dalmanni]|uniref:uncharacterized protein C1orf50 homolog n=1 Tax=Teleopsis dalmanni TaxID=139649 RepID=UPI0018CD219D|nr:uncharacterized protein C1orf50 homolog [Teleopsis dalmanni]